MNAARFGRGVRARLAERSARRLETIALHEAGHVVAARMLGATDVTASVDRARGGFSFTVTSPFDEAVVLLAGREAEVALTGVDAGGSSYDLRQARRALGYRIVPLASARSTAAELVHGARLDIETEAARLLDAAYLGRRSA
ncbi:hypothetical protein [Parafrankia sp. FMc2]|uniref:hypothetical protein n=1 Tax=Parafrankia sp. FMc2 TaxID=3233196 RepID=UPI0034D5AE1A